MEVDDPASDGEELVDAEVPEAALSPASKRARKRAVAARNKRLAKEQKNGQAAPSSSSSIPAPPTFVQAQQQQPSAASSIEARLDAPFIQQQQQQQQEQKKSEAQPAQPKKPDLQRVPTMIDDGASSFSTDFEDTSLLVDGDSSSSSSEDEQQQEVQNAKLEPPTPRASQRTFTDKASAAAQSTAHGALESVKESNAVPEAMSEQADEAQDSVEQNEKEAAALGASQKPVDHGSDHDPTKKWKSIITRTVWTLIMIAGFCGGSAQTQTDGTVY